MYSYGVYILRTGEIILLQYDNNIASRVPVAPSWKLSGQMAVSDMRNLVVCTVQQRSTPSARLYHYYNVALFLHSGNSRNPSRD
jgi:hypothetical protein